MSLTVVADEGQLIHVSCAGDVSQRWLAPGEDPWITALGPAGYGRKVLLSLEKANYMDSSGVGWLLGSHKRFRQAGGNLVLHSVPPLVNPVLQMLRLDLIVPTADNEAAARELALGGSP
jgi:anti-anti-sigma factor